MSIVKETGGMIWFLMAVFLNNRASSTYWLRAGPSLLIALIDGRTRPSHLASN